MSSNNTLPNLPDSLLLIVEEFPYPIQVFSYAGLLVYANTAWEEMWHATADNLIGQYNAFEAEPLEQMGLRDLMLKARDGVKIQFPDFEFDPALIGGPGRKRWIRSYAFRLVLEPDDTIFIIVLNFDITEQIEVENRLNQYIEKLTETQNQLILQERLGAIGQLAAGISHDFNNILAIIMLEAQMMSRLLKGNEGLRARAEAIVAQSERGALLIRQILDFSRSSISKKEPININQWLEEFIALSKRTLPATIEVESRLLKNSHFIEANQTQLQQIFMNLIINARDAIDGNGKISINMTFGHRLPAKFASLTHQKVTDGYVVIKVEDNGVGIAEEHLENIFDPFFTTKAYGEGFGLGLSQAYGIVKQHFGFIDCASEVGKGTCFTLYFPTLNEPFEQNFVNQGSTHAGQALKREVILLVEDHPLTRQSIQDVLEMFDYRVVTAVNGKDALDKLKTQASRIDLVLTDIVMPKMGGQRLRNEIQAQYPHLKVIFMTGFVTNQSEIIGELMQDAVVIEKPFSIELLTKTLQAELGEIR
ncbi:MAG: ATP-binding protein [Chloroflexota bacterium]